LRQSALVLTLAALCSTSALSWTSKAGAEETTTHPERVVPPLGVVLRQARSQAPQVRLGEAALAVSRAESINAGRAPLENPYFEVVGQHGSNQATRGVAWGGTVWLPFEISGQRGRRMDEAEAYQAMFEADLDVAEAASLGEAYAAFGATHVAAERIRIVEQMVAIARRTAEIYDARLASGDAVLRDATMAKVELARNEVLLQDAKSRFALALTQLSRSTGERYTHVDAPVLSPPQVELASYVGRIEKRLPPLVTSADSEAKYFESQKARLESETLGPLSLMLLGGRGDLGETRVGVGLAYEVPVVRSLQGEKARASSEAMRAQTQMAVARSVIERRVDGIAQQYTYEQNAYELLTNVALPAAEHAVSSATATWESGKTDWFAVLLSRRDLMTLSLERLDVVARQWSQLGELIHLTGELP
jgi:cobalt-zinc-cadmium efflux system outer membrane protein